MFPLQQIVYIHHNIQFMLEYEILCSNLACGKNNTPVFFHGINYLKRAFTFWIGTRKYLQPAEE